MPRTFKTLDTPQTHARMFRKSFLRQIEGQPAMSGTLGQFPHDLHGCFEKHSSYHSCKAVFLHIAAHILAIKKESGRQRTSENAYQCCASSVFYLRLEFDPFDSDAPSSRLTLRLLTPSVLFPLNNTLNVATAFFTVISIMPTTPTANTLAAATPAVTPAAAVTAVATSIMTGSNAVPTTPPTAAAITLALFPLNTPTAIIPPSGIDAGYNSSVFCIPVCRALCGGFQRACRQLSGAMTGYRYYFWITHLV